MPRGEVNKVSVSKACQWLQDNLGDWYIGYYSNGEPYIDTKLVLRDFRKDFHKK